MNAEQEMLNGLSELEYAEYMDAKYMLNASDGEDEYSYYDEEGDQGIGYAVMSDSASSDYRHDNRNKNKKRDSYESTDKNRHKLIRKIKGKKTEIIVYSSPLCPGACIRDAVTGTRMREYLVGSVNEHQFYKVKFATGEMGQDAGSCFFDSPEQYEKHMYQTVTNEQKDIWANKCASVRAAYN